MASFSFSFSGDDIEGDDHDVVAPPTGAATAAVSHEAETSHSAAAPAASAFPVQGKPQLPPLRHSLKDMLARLPSKIAYGLLNVELEIDDRSSSSSSSSSTLWIHLPRRELWDVRLQVMAEADDDDDSNSNDTAGEIAPGLGSHDVKTGIYEGGFKSWESSVDLVKVLLQSDAESPSSSRLSAVAANVLSREGPARVVELGCGTALPSLAIFQWACANRAPPEQDGSRPPLSFTVADYNPSVLHLVTLPNLLLVWAMQQRHVEPVLLEALDEDEDEDGVGNTPGGELQLTDAVKDAFCAFLGAAGITLSFLSGGWSPAFVDLLRTSDDTSDNSGTNTLVLGAETIYSPFALESFSDTLLSVLRHEHGAAAKAAAVVGAKKLYFGVGGSLDDFVRRMRDAGALVTELREEADGVRRGVVQCLLA